MTIQEVKAAHPLPEVAASYGLKIGRNRMARCPFHPGDRTASLKIYDDHFHCFGCGAHGDAVDFLARMEHIDFKAALQRLGGLEEENPMARYAAAKKAQNRREATDLLDDIGKYELKKVTDRITAIRANGEPEPFSDGDCELIELDMKLRIFEEEYSNEKRRRQCPR